MKKKLWLILTVCFLFNTAKAQSFGISTTGALPNASAALDVDFTNKGVLIPRVALSSLTDAVTIATPATSLLLYSQGGAIADGYYYNSGTPAAPIWSSFITTASTVNGCFTNWQLFTANGTFTVPAGITKIKVCVYGGGAGGCSGYTNSQLGGGGGGAGGYAEGIFTVVSLSNYAVTIGAGGSGGASGGGLGNNGSSSAFGALLSATGGSAPPTYGVRGEGGTGSGGYFNSCLGSGGGTGNNGSGDGGTGGGAAVGSSGTGGGGGGGNGGGCGGYAGIQGSDALANSGAGGGGGGGNNGAGGNGAAGKVIVFW